MSLQNRVAMITGAGGGLGRAHALYLASQGAQIVVNDVSEDAATRVVQEIEAAGGQARSAPASVTDEQAVERLVARTLHEWGRIDILVNNAGVLRDRSFSKMSVADFRSVLDVHLMGSVICTKAVWEAMRAQKHGRIVMTSSSSGLFGNFGQSNYGAAKMALVGLMQTLAIEGQKYGIHVNCLAPSAATQMTAELLPEQSLRRLDPSRVSPVLGLLVEDQAPTRTILCTGAGHVASAHITLTRGAFLGTGGELADDRSSTWSRVLARQDDFVPAYGFFQVEREVESAALNDDAP